MTTAVIVFIACHAGPAEHFAAFAKECPQPIQVYASGPAAKIFQAQGITFSEFSTEEPAEVLASKIDKKAQTIITDLGHVFDISLHRALETHPAKVFAYYDNPEPFVPGGYSETAQKVITASKKSGVLFANSRLANQPIFSAPHQPIDFQGKTRIGIGYYPLENATKVIEARKNNTAARQAFFSQHRLVDSGQKILVYFGGNNTAYFEEAFPCFLDCLKDMQDPNILFVLHQHPGAKKENKDIQLITQRGLSEQVIVSTLPSSMDALILADTALYFQTSMGPLFVLAQVPIIQVGTTPYEDLLVTNNLCQCASSSQELSTALMNKTDPANPDIIKKQLGINPDWIHILTSTFQL